MIVTRIFAILSVIASLGQAVLREAAPQMDMDGYLYLVNRQHTISAAYVPPDLVLPLREITSCHSVDISAIRFLYSHLWQSFYITLLMYILLSLTHYVNYFK